MMMRVLIADDHDLLRDTLELWFRQEKIEVATARDLEGALAAVAKQESFDLILLDYGMPGMNGLDGLRQALDGARGTRVALMSGIAPRDVAEKALEMGAAGFLPKTLPAKSLVNAVRFMAFSACAFVLQNTQKSSAYRTGAYPASISLVSNWCNTILHSRGEITAPSEIPTPGTDCPCAIHCLIRPETIESSTFC